MHLINWHVSTHVCAHVCAPKCARTYARERLSAHTHTRAHPQFNHKHYALGCYAAEADAAAARDVVAKVLGNRLNFTKPRKITGQRSEGADQAVADAVKAANAFLSGDFMTTFFRCVAFLGKNNAQHPNRNPKYHAPMTPS